MNRPPIASPAPARAAGFTLVELLVSLLLLVELLVAALVLFDFNGRVARVQTHLSDMQQNLRVAQNEVVRVLRMAGRGGLEDMMYLDPTAPAPPFDVATFKYFPQGVSVEVRNNVPEDATLLEGVAEPAVAELTDVLTIRGSFSLPVLFVNYQDPDSFEPVDAALGGSPSDPIGRVTVQRLTTSGLVQDLGPLAAIIAADVPIPEALVIVSPVEDTDYAVVQLSPGQSVVTEVGGIVERIDIAFVYPGDDDNATGTHDLDYIKLSPNQRFPADLTSAISVGVLEEYRFFVRERFSDEFGSGTDRDLDAALTRARVLPNTQELYPGEPPVDVADNIVDLQVALGVDTDGDDLVGEAEPGGAYASDEWLLNHDDDDPEEARWDEQDNRLFYVRLNLLARTDRRDPGYASPPITRIEDADYSEAIVPATERNRRDRLFRRRLLSTVIDLRNL